MSCFQPIIIAKGRVCTYSSLREIHFCSTSSSRSQGSAGPRKILVRPGLVSSGLGMFETQWRCRWTVEIQTPVHLFKSLG